MSFDTRFCLARLQNKSTFEYWGFEWQITEDSEHNIIASSEYFDKACLTVLFKPVGNAGNVLQLIDGYKDFRDRSMIENDLPYRILSTLCMEHTYKLLLYTLVKLPRHLQSKQIKQIRNGEDETYDRLKACIELYEGSPLLYEKEEERVKQIKFKRNKKLRKSKGKHK